ncbi:MAG: bifunctional nuclease family protein [Gemmatimonadota bacterium]
MVEVRVQTLGLDRTSNTPVVILKEIEGDRILPIWIGPGEASAIAMQLAEMEFERPLTHDLLVSVLRALGGVLQRVLISKVEKGTYYAELIVHRNGSVIALDARPSDSIAVALRMNARIFADDALLEHSTVDLSIHESEGGTVGESPPSPPPTAEGGEAENLEEYLRRLDPEDFGRFKP